eukprot:gene585-730_t
MSAKTQNYHQLEVELTKITHLKNIANVAYWDVEINLPTGAVANRHQELATLAEVIHQTSTSKTLGNLIQAAMQEIDALDAWQKANLLLIKKDYEQAQCISPKLQHAYSVATGEAEYVWREARKNNDFNQLVPYLDRVFELSRNIADCKAQYFKQDPYDMLMDTYDTGSNTRDVEEVFQILKNELPGLVKQIMAKQSAEHVLPFSEKVAIETQKALSLFIMERMEFDMAKGRLDASAHPFCGGSNDDVRLTTRYEEENLLSGLLGTMHETGHGLYQQNLPATHRNQPVGHALGLTFHESQSLIMEYQVGTSWEFMQFLSKTLRDQFGLQGAVYEAENLYRLVTRVQPSLIRIDADEVTYPLHIILRFEIEQAIIKDKLRAVELPDLWHAKMQEYLGITPPDNRNGCMQDVHWPSGAVGYFPCYTKGAIVASMLMEAAEKQLPATRKQFSEGKLSNLNHYLNEQVRGFGSLLNATSLLEGATGYKKVNPHIFLRYLKRKYLNLA